MRAEVMTDISNSDLKKRKEKKNRVPKGLQEVR